MVCSSITMAKDCVIPLSTGGSMPNTAVSRSDVTLAGGAMTLGVAELSSPKSHLLSYK